MFKHVSIGDVQPTTFFAPCPRGLELVLRDEFSQLGIHEPEVIPGGVRFSGPFDVCYRVNLQSRIASRVLWAVGQQTYSNENDIYAAAMAFPWSSWFPSHCTIKVLVKAHHCPLRSLEFITLRIKDAICDQFRKSTGRRPNVDTRSPDLRIYAFLDHQTVTFYLDTTGEPLFKRGYRKDNGTSPIRENLAAGILRLTGWTPDQMLIDPMCGSGTFLIEAAHISTRTAPGLNRSFAFEKFSHFDQERWERLRVNIQGEHRPLPVNSIMGFDLDCQAVHAARINLKAAGFEDTIPVNQSDVLELCPPTPPGILVTNPPYGKRMGKGTALTDWYPLLGNALKRNFIGWRAFIFTADFRLPKLIRLAARRKTPLFNGALECRLLEYPIVQGSHRGTRRLKVGSG